MSKIHDLKNQRFGRLTVICQTTKRASRHIVWLCRCDCGNLVEVGGDKLLSGNNKSCGCFRREKAINNPIALKHGDSANGKPSRFYVSWAGMKHRCLCLNSDGYKYYGGRGITVCEEWLNYQNFRDWALANGYQDNLTIDRIDNEGNYEPSNCQWITKSENSKKSHKERKKGGKNERREVCSRSTL